jgi:hypothetical protein
MHPDLLESKIVLSYFTFLLPAGADQRGRDRTTRNTSPAITLLTVLTFFIWAMFAGLQSFGALPYALQKALIKVAQPIIFSGLVLLRTLFRTYCRRYMQGRLHTLLQWIPTR